MRFERWGGGGNAIPSGFRDAAFNSNRVEVILECLFPGFGLRRDFYTSIRPLCKIARINIIAETSSVRESRGNGKIKLFTDASEIHKCSTRAHARLRVVCPRLSRETDGGGALDPSDSLSYDFIFH